VHTSGPFVPSAYYLYGTELTTHQLLGPIF